MVNFQMTVLQDGDYLLLEEYGVADALSRLEKK
jgi:hypothetical protein